MTELITFIGYNNSGKSTSASRLSKMLKDKGYTCVVRSFATPLKELASIYCNYQESNKIKQRPILEKMAFDIKKIFGITVFGYTLLDSIQHLDVDYVIIDDMRFKEEYNVISEFFTTYVIKTPQPELVSESDDIRLSELLWYLDCNSIPYFEMKGFGKNVLNEFINDLK